MQRRTLIILAAALVLIAAGVVAYCLVVGCGGREAEAVVTRRDITERETLSGESTAPAAAEANILPPYAAPVERVYVTEGQQVREGDVLMQLSAPSSQAYYQQARQRVLQAETSLRQARVQYDSRIRRARSELTTARERERSVRASLQAAQAGEEVTVTGEDLQDAVSARREAEQAVIDAEAAAEAGLVPYQRSLANARQELADAESGVKAAMIRTPISGTVLSLDARAGQDVDPENEKPVARVVNLEALRVYAEVGESAMRDLKPGAPATFTFGDVPGEQFTGTLRNVYSQDAGFLRGVEHVAVFDIRNREGLVKPGMDASVRVTVGTAENALAVPASAVEHSDDGHIVHVRSGDEWRARAVDIGVSDGRYTQITSGLREGDVVRVEA